MASAARPAAHTPGPVNSARPHPWAPPSRAPASGAMRGNQPDSASASLARSTRTPSDNPAWRGRVSQAFGSPAASHRYYGTPPPNVCSIRNIRHFPQQLLQKLDPRGIPPRRNQVPSQRQQKFERLWQPRPALFQHLDRRVKLLCLLKKECQRQVGIRLLRSQLNCQFQMFDRLGTLADILVA